MYEEDPWGLLKEMAAKLDAAADATFTVVSPFDASWVIALAVPIVLPLHV